MGCQEAQCFFSPVSQSWTTTEEGSGDEEQSPFYACMDAFATKLI